MTYTALSLIEAADYNTFRGSNDGQRFTSGLGRVTGTNNYTGTVASVETEGYNYGSLASVSNTTTVTASQWASLVNTINTVALHQGTTITTRTAPTSGDLIQILADVQTDIDALYTNRGRMANANPVQFTNSVTRTTNCTGVGTLTFIADIQIGSSNLGVIRGWFNRGGMIRITFSKTSTGNTGDPEWNDLANNLMDDIYITGGGSLERFVGGVSYGTGLFGTGGTGTPAVNNSVGYFDLSPGAVGTEEFRQNADTAPYTGNYINIIPQVFAGSNILRITSQWRNAEGDTITGAVGTGPTMTVTALGPDTTYLGSYAAASLTGLSVAYA